MQIERQTVIKIKLGERETFRIKNPTGDETIEVESLRSSSGAMFWVKGRLVKKDGAAGETWREFLAYASDLPLRISTELVQFFMTEFEDTTATADARLVKW